VALPAFAARRRAVAWLVPIASKARLTHSYTQIAHFLQRHNGPYIVGALSQQKQQTLRILDANLSVLYQSIFDADRMG